MYLLNCVNLETGYR